tara:strand:- start:36 stop:368 length:333 start_codon:yes stop_codon:yes gene_type:complete
MKTYVPILLLTVLFLFPNQGSAEINSKKALMDVFEGCVEEEVTDLPLGAQFEYCGCYVKEISLGMDLEELMSFGLDMLSAGEDEEKREKIMLSNEKITKYVVNCASKLYE